MKVLVIGHQEAVLGFSLVGVEGRVVSSAAEVNQALDEAFSGLGSDYFSDSNCSEINHPQDGPIKTAKHDSAGHRDPRSERPPPGEPSLSEIVLRAIGIKI